MSPSIDRSFTGSSLGDIKNLISEDHGQYTADFHQLQLYSAFQPIFSFAHPEPVGYEALVRVNDAQQQALSPATLFEQPRTLEEKVLLDRLCRTLHIKNYMAQSDGEGWLFLNISPQVVMDGKHFSPFFSHLLQHLNVPPHRIVVEIVEKAITHEADLAKAVEYYKELGCLIAIDDFGAGHSNFERLWHMEPHIVKLDRSITAQAAQNMRVQRLLNNLVSLIHETGALALLEGVETEEEALVAMASDVDMVQGFYFARPNNTLVTASTAENTPLALSHHFSQLLMKSNDYNRKLVLYRTLFQQATASLAAYQALDVACHKLLTKPAVAHCYVIDAQGFQRGANITTRISAHCRDSRYQPLMGVDGASWFRRPYFREAIMQPGQIHTSRPYLSLTGGHMCLTLSTTFERDGELLVFCCDLDCETLQAQQ